ncbi:hypothetical protein ACWD4G_32990 [Streptomyces sp. NPDC002643]
MDTRAVGKGLDVGLPVFGVYAREGAGDVGLVECDGTLQRAAPLGGELLEMVVAAQQLGLLAQPFAAQPGQTG